MTFAPFATEYHGLQHTSIVIPACKRAKCQMCGKPLKLLTHRFIIDAGNEEEFREKVATKVLAWSRVEWCEPTVNEMPKVSPGKTTMLIQVWYGRFQGYSVDADGIPLFCTRPCAIGFAGLAYRSGIRALKEEVIKQCQLDVS